MNSKFVFLFSLMSLTRGWVSVQGSGLGCYLKSPESPHISGPWLNFSPPHLPPQWFKECGGNHHFYFSFVIPGFAPRVTSVENCIQQCVSQNSKRNSIFLSRGLWKEASEGKIVLGDPREQRAGEGDIILCMKLYKSQIHLWAAHVWDRPNAA